MPLLNLQTNLKSLQYGKDRPGGGNSGQPYETTPIPGNNDPIDPNSEDFLLRGGLNGARDTFTDLKRLSKFFNDDNSSEGALFVIKQNLLSKIGVRTQASGIGFNEGAYTPLSTLAQAGISIEGGHIPKQGLIPFAGPNTYLEETVPTLFRKTTIIGEENGKNNRLVQLTQVKIDNSLTWKSKFKSKNQIAKNPNAILSYSGGPSSLAGLLGTRIPFATDPQGAPLRTGVNNSKLIRIGSKEVFITPNTFQPITSDTDPRFTELPLGASNSFNKTTPNNAFTLGDRDWETNSY